MTGLTPEYLQAQAEEMTIIELLDEYRCLRQMLYDRSRLFPNLYLQDAALDAELTYATFAARHNKTYVPPFDSEEHTRQRVAEGHPDYPPSLYPQYAHLAPRWVRL